MPLLTACHDDDDIDLGPLVPETEAFGKANDVFSADEWYPGGQLGTTEKASYSAATPAVVNIAGMEEDFNTGEDFFEHLYTFEQNPRKGLGPAWVRNSCIACHPSYGHGKRQTEYRANQIGNGYLLVVYHPSNNAYISEVTGMPQTQAMSPFKAPIDETQIKIEWPEVKEMESGLPMQFADGEKYSLIYPVVTIPQTAFNTNPKPTEYDVRLESTIGLYGTGLLDALDDADIEAQWRSEAPYVDLNPAMWDKEANAFKTSAYYAAPYNDTGSFHGSRGPLKRFTYAMTHCKTVPVPMPSGTSPMLRAATATGSTPRPHGPRLRAKIARSSTTSSVTALPRRASCIPTLPTAPTKASASASTKF